MNPSVIRSLGAAAPPKPNAVREIAQGASEASAGITAWRRNALRLGRMPAACRDEAATPFGIVAPSRICDRVLFPVLMTHSRFHDARQTIVAHALYPAKLPNEITRE